MPHEGRRDDEGPGLGVRTSRVPVQAPPLSSCEIMAEWSCHLAGLLGVLSEATAIIAVCASHPSVTIMTSWSSPPASQVHGREYSVLLMGKLRHVSLQHGSKDNNETLLGKCAVGFQGQLLDRCPVHRRSAGIVEAEDSSGTEGVTVAL